MKSARRLACVVVAVCTLAFATDWLASEGYAKQFREAPGSPRSRTHLLCTDELGRDRFVRVRYGTRVSLLLAPGAALVSAALEVLVGGLAGYLNGVWLENG
jgi:peptide/nickel transport system permease protein